MRYEIWEETVLKCFNAFLCWLFLPLCHQNKLNIHWVVIKCYCKYFYLYRCWSSWSLHPHSKVCCTNRRTSYSDIHKDIDILRHFVSHPLPLCSERCLRLFIDWVLQHNRATKLLCCSLDFILSSLHFGSKWSYIRNLCCASAVKY